MDILCPQCLDDLASGQVARSRAVRIDPDPHRIIAATEHSNTSDTLEPKEAVTQVGIGEIAEVIHVQIGIGRRQGDDHQEARRLLVDGHADLPNLFRQPRLRERDAVLDQHLRGVEVCPGLERDSDLSRAVGRR